jgi:hypothetical protein
VSQNQSWTTCQQFTINGMGAKRLPRHSEAIVAAAWPPSYSDTLISNIENETNLPTTGYCNSNSQSGLFPAADNSPTPANLETIPGTATSGFYAVRTGSTSTQNCVSLHGIQDMAGNISYWTSDQLGGCTSGASTPYTCNGIVSALDPTNTDLYWDSGAAQINFDGITGPGGGSTTTSNWNLSAESFHATEFLPALGIPLVSGVSSLYGSMKIGIGAGQFNPAKFHGNVFTINTNNGKPSRGAHCGGAFGSGSMSGRFNLGFYYAPTNTISSYGVGHCLIQVGN